MLGRKNLQRIYFMFERILHNIINTIDMFGTEINTGLTQSSHLLFAELLWFCVSVSECAELHGDSPWPSPSGSTVSVCVCWIATLVTWRHSALRPRQTGAFPPPKDELPHKERVKLRPVLPKWLCNWELNQKMEIHIYVTLHSGNCSMPNYTR